MREISYIIALLGVLVLLAAAPAWMKANGARELKLVASGQHSRPAGAAAIATFVAVGLAAVAAIFAIIGWMIRG